jgi:cytidylate kinase
LLVFNFNNVNLFKSFKSKLTLWFLNNFSLFLFLLGATMNQDFPVIAIDGTTASGKGTIAQMLATHFGFNYLNSGALYRLVAFQYGGDFQNPEIGELKKNAQDMKVKFDGEKVFLNNAEENIWPKIKSQDVGNNAAIVARILEVREAVHKFQKMQIVDPGLVAEGRDMTTNVFAKEAQVKIFLDAHLGVRAQRRSHQDPTKTLDQLIKEISARDVSDMTREHGKLYYPAENHGIFYLDTTVLDPKQTLEAILKFCKERGLEKNI